MNTRPLWTDETAIPRFPALDEDIEVEVLVIGGGITGVSTAQLLGRTGMKVALLERDHLACGDTAHTTAHLTYMTDTRLTDLIKLCGEEKAMLGWMAGRQAMEKIRKTAEMLGADVELVDIPGYLVAHDSADMEKETSLLREEADMAREMGFDVSYIESIPPTGRPGIRFNGQMKFHPLKYLSALVADAVKQGVRIHEETDVREFGEEPTQVIANGHRIIYQHVVIATHVPLQGNRGTVGAALFQTKLASYSTYAVAALAPSGSLPEMIWSDTAEPFNYLRVDRSTEGDRIILGGQDHKTGQLEETGESFEKLGMLLRGIAPDARITHQWSGQVVETVDGLPYIGENLDGQFIATGFSGNGMTFGVAAAMMARDKITGRANDWEEAFSPKRVELAATGNYIRENKDFPCLMVTDRMGIPAGELADIGTGEGRVMKVGGETLAVCRDSEGTPHLLCAVCPHLGCIVAWNESELTWDCPCHGSRFEADGTLIAGPAEEGLHAPASS